MEVLEFLECLLDIAFHGHLYPPVGVVKFKVDANVLFCIPVNLEGVFFADTSNEVVCISLGRVADCKIIHDQGEGCWTRFMCE